MRRPWHLTRTRRRRRTRTRRRTKSRMRIQSLSDGTGTIPTQASNPGRNSEGAEQKNQRKMRRRPDAAFADDAPHRGCVPPSHDAAATPSSASSSSSPQSSRPRRAACRRGAALRLMCLIASTAAVGSAEASEVSRRRPLGVPPSPASAAVAATATSAAEVHRAVTSSILPSPTPSLELSSSDGSGGVLGSETGASSRVVESLDSIDTERFNSTDGLATSPPSKGAEANEFAEQHVAEVETDLDESMSAPSTDLDWASRSALATLQSSSFMSVLAVSCVALAPAPALSARLGTDRAMSLLSSLAAITATVEIALSPMLGSVLDSFGRKRAMVVAQLAIVAAHALAAVELNLLTICLAKAAALLCGGQLFVISHTMIADLTASRPERLGAVLGTQSALISAGFLSGAILGGRLAERGLRLCYGASAIFAAAGAANFLLRMHETLPEKDRVPFDPAAARRKVIEAPISCTKLLVGHGAAMRMLSILLVLLTVPINMGDVFQVFTSKEWGLKPRAFSQFIALVGLIGIVSNAASRVLIPRIGLKRFTSIAILSSLAFPIGTFFSYGGALVGACLGCLASAQKLGIMAAIAAQGTKAGVPQGQLAGEKASLLALLKVIGPVLYSALYRKGTKIGMPNLPFVFNMVLSVAALVLCQKYLE